jgi:hypothetical protein
MMRDSVYQAPRLVGHISARDQEFNQTDLIELLGFDGVVAEVSLAHVVTLMLF